MNNQQALNIPSPSNEKKKQIKKVLNRVLFCI